MAGAESVHGEVSYDDDGVAAVVVVDNNAAAAVVAVALSSDVEEPFSVPSLHPHSQYGYPGPVATVNSHQSAEELLHQCCGFARGLVPLDTYLSCDEGLGE